MNKPQEKYSGLTRKVIADITTQQMTPTDPNKTNEEDPIEVDRGTAKALKEVAKKLERDPNKAIVERK